MILESGLAAKEPDQGRHFGITDRTSSPGLEAKLLPTVEVLFLTFNRAISTRRSEALVSEWCVVGFEGCSPVCFVIIARFDYFEGQASNGFPVS